MNKIKNYLLIGLKFLGTDYAIKTLFMCTLLFCSLVTMYKIIFLNEEVDEYKQHIYIIDNKLSSNTDYYYDESNLLEKLKNTAAGDLTSCLQDKLDTTELSSSITNTIEELNNLFNASYDNFSFKYQDIYTGFSISYNENQTIFAASTIKAPSAIYLYEMASKGEINLDDLITYTGYYYNTGSGILKNTEFNRDYTTRELIKYTIYYSDNAAHNMLMDKYGRENRYNFWSSLGTNAIFKYPNNWGAISSHDATIYFNELYRFYQENDEYGNELMDNFLNAGFKLIKGKDDSIKIANKAGWSGSTIHDAGIVFDKNPYTLVILTNLAEQNYNYLFNTVSSKISYIHNEYWKLKMDKCNEIEQY